MEKYLPGFDVEVLVTEFGVVSVVSVNFPLHRSVLHLQACVLTPPASSSMHPGMAPGILALLLSKHFRSHNSPELPSV